MAIPDYQAFMLPLLRWAKDGAERHLHAAYLALADEFKLSDDERAKLLPSGRQPVLNNRVGWAKMYMLKAGLLEKTRRGYFKITQRGKEVLSSNPTDINVKFLNRFPEFVEFRTASNEDGESPHNEAEVTEAVAAASTTPEETLERAYQSIRRGLAEELLQVVKDSTPEFFENLVIDLLVRMGYGGSKKEASAVGRSGDGGIDGIIKEDKLGLDAIYVQAKKWVGTTVSRPEIQKFAGALQGQRARKGIFLTTSDFSAQAKDFVKNIESKIILIDGTTLADLMIDHNVGVSLIASYDLKRIDTDYFDEN